MIPTRPARGRTAAIVHRNLLDAGRRNIHFSAAAIPGHLAMAGWKTSLLLVTPSLFVLANVVFTLGLAVIKALIVGAHRRQERGNLTAVQRAYGAGGVLLIGLAVVYVVCCLPYLVGSSTSGVYSDGIAIAIATVTFVELGFAIHGLVSSRRRGDVLMEMNKLANLGASLVLVVLTQTALLSMAGDGDYTFANGVCGLIAGALVAVIGTRMVLRRFPDATDQR